MKKEVFGAFKGDVVYRYVLENASGYKVAVMNYGATLLAYETPDKNGNFANIVVATPRFEEYINNAPRWGATIGPVAGRIAHGEFTLNEVTYKLEKNNGQHHLHGGSNGYEQVLFDVEDVDTTQITFVTHQVSMAQGYPGNITLKVTYTLEDNGALTISYEGVSDADTLFNPTNHAYFNLSGNVNQTIDSQEVLLQASGYTVLDVDNIPTGEINATDSFFQKLVKGSSFGDIFADTHEQIVSRNGLDHAFVLHNVDNQLTIYDAESQRKLTVTTQAPAVVMYTSNGFDNKTFLDGKQPVIHHGVAIETQVLPDAINQKGFGNMVLKANQVFTSRTTYRATVEK